MTDVAKCNGMRCAQRETCYRYLAPSNEYWQAWYAYDELPAPCPMYWPMRVYAPA